MEKKLSAQIVKDYYRFKNRKVKEKMELIYDCPCGCRNVTEIDSQKNVPYRLDTFCEKCNIHYVFEKDK